MALRQQPDAERIVEFYGHDRAKQIYSFRMSWITRDGQRESRWFLWTPQEFENELASVIRDGCPVFVEAHR